MSSTVVAVDEATEAPRWQSPGITRIGSDRTTALSLALCRKSRGPDANSNHLNLVPCPISGLSCHRTLYCGDVFKTELWSTVSFLSGEGEPLLCARSPTYGRVPAGREPVGEYVDDRLIERDFSPKMAAPRPSTTVRIPQHESRPRSRFSISAAQHGAAGSWVGLFGRGKMRGI